MTAFFFLLLLLVAYHFLYENVVGPSMRMHARNELFTLRDELRALKADGVSANNDEAFWQVHGGLNFLLHSLGLFTMTSGIAARHAYNSDTAFKQRVDAKLHLVEQCSDPRIRDIHRRAAKLVQVAFVANAGGWLVYVVPIGLCATAFGKVRGLAARLALTSESDARRIMKDEMSVVA